VSAAGITWPVTSAAQAVDQRLIDTLVEVGGYPHPLFHPTPEQRAQGIGAPLMGQGVLLLAGGLAERSGALDDAIALLGFTDVTFRTMVRAGTTVRLVLDLLSTTPTSSGKRRSEYRWTVLDDADGVVLEATAVMLRTPLEEEAR
jgi:hypothetical protein